MSENTATKMATLSLDPSLQAQDKPLVSPLGLGVATMHHSRQFDRRTEQAPVDTAHEDAYQQAINNVATEPGATPLEYSEPHYEPSDVPGDVPGRNAPYETVAAPLEGPISASQPPVSAPGIEPTPFGKDMLKHFSFDPSYTNINHGSFGAFPRVIREKQRAYQDLCESAPDPFIRKTYSKLLNESREAVAQLMNCPASTVVLQPNATTGVNVVLRNIVWNYHGKDEIIYFKHIYEACLKTIEYVCEANHNLVNAREIVIQYPIEDADLVAAFREVIRVSRAQGKNPRLAIFDTVSSLPGVRQPFEELTKICKEEGVWSLIDGAHGIGHIPIDLSALDPDFFVSNLHKWLYVPRACSMLYVPERNQHLMRSTLPTSHGFLPRAAGRGASNPIPSSAPTHFLANFEYSGTMDNTNYCVVPDAIHWRQQVCGGEKAIMDYCISLAKEGGKIAANVLGTKILENASGTLTNCCLANVLLPLKLSDSKLEGLNTIKPEYAVRASGWMQQILMNEYQTFIAIYFFQGAWWARLSAQIYLDLSDFEWAGLVLKEICERVGKDEFLASQDDGKVVSYSTSASFALRKTEAVETEEPSKAEPTEEIELVKDEAVYK